MKQKLLIGLLTLAVTICGSLGFSACTKPAPDTGNNSTPKPPSFDVPANEEQWIEAWTYADSITKIAIHTESEYGNKTITEEEFENGDYTLPEANDTAIQNTKANLSLKQSRTDCFSESDSFNNWSRCYVGYCNKINYSYKYEDYAEDWGFDTEEFENEAEVSKFFYTYYGILGGLNSTIAMYGADVNLKNAFNNFTYNAETNEFTAHFSGEYRPPLDDDFLEYEYNHAEIDFSLQFKNGKLIKAISSTVVILQSYGGGININVGTSTTTFPDYGEDEVIPTELLEQLLATN